jgi:hypothetical protein
VRSCFIIMLFGAAGLWVGPAAPAHAQAGAAAGDTLVFEQVGDRPPDANDLAFDGAGALWAIDADVWRLPPGATAWEEVALVPASYILPLGADTLLVGFNAVRRSLDGGETFEEVYDEGEALFEAPASGVLLTGTRVGSGVAFSHDRGATWAEGQIDSGSWIPDAHAFAELPPGHADAGRLVAGCTGGLSYSDDGGVTWAKSSLWEDSGRYYVTSVAVGVDGRVYAAFVELGVAGTQVAVSEDGGATYEVVYGFGVPVGSEARIVALPGGADPAVGVVVLVEFDGSVWRSDDAAASWRQVGQIPFVDPFPSSSLEDAVLGVDGRLYVAGGKSGPEDEWVYRTTEPVVTAQEPGAPGETGVVLEVAPNPFRGEATVTFEVSAPSRVRLAVYDVLGREVAVLADGPFAPGRYEAAFDGGSLAAGLYLVEARAESAAGARRTSAERVTLVR